MSDIINIAKNVIHTEIEGLDYMSSRLDNEFVSAIEAIIKTSGRVIICGMGKSGIIGKKIAASFASTGTPSFFMHPGEAFHGDLGMVTSDDVFIAISNSGETDEVLKLLPFLQDNGNYIISITGNSVSTLARNSHCHLDISVPKEACPLQLAPTTSTTATLVMGDAMTVVLMEERGFQPENFARFHPGGSLGRKLLAKVKDEMISEKLPLIPLNTPFLDILSAITKGQCGVVLVEIEDGFGIITDGDLRRFIENKKEQSFDCTARELVNIEPIVIDYNENMSNAFEVMEKEKVNFLLVESGKEVLGVVKK
ncbi:KpsF/GutQ family sugar-phosphate isomerase [Vibrio parahaemolyticus]|uniref:KpsF/GutQ family sugar-phosphate isomerase n=1 Tax=Vibrio parahaemolyticus TaxID=670 RepID=UPI0015BC2839|nr:KpsF/GutQ family sugar-phosphate isomerase [Vibrio parahaemolyticus]MBE4326490.1 KpsF/GutQ family sugar-phosphate isomerase [Vibrio parahaemolyticus]QLE28631.1 KpsF/GutQ family sugar-phosphate isomerase [Vibrio parahaemolyticus]HCE1879352.1 KpsF/GutQ family sugar-phosphate isomerase [Vibrio parahaemolyticus]HCE3644028.1 KpsF/GutQ family sugar-phosphate isomerase [Vibrio parahaemolyticus]HCE4534418.1 KpsF/GutQ family sugar-phosphate isomerase [Vibrio parahaemolyticus]